ncbi:phage tail length tape measure family protein [Mesorhizobium sp. M7A.F.Ca.ET.027.03.2.1]|uniref:phage tail length tape measure family protein n=1 Tax=Mesorhizobium sp. M7A.F.Ca.ET.027.03.2.1 TaxID=2496656 RepID=UPI0016728505|nr:phage tail length tape measure family protein [Mesorhizobium sp. M7A.F.Ca.ET.027.03.2.1]
MDQTLKYNIVGDASSLLRAHEDAKRSGAALTSQLSSGFNETTVTIQRSVAAVTAMQARINDMVGIGSRGTKEWTGALAQQGQILDQLRAKYSPLYAAQQTYLANLNDIKAAHSIGALSADEMSAAIVREKAAFAATVVNMSKVGGAAKLTSNQLLNLSRQGNDVATMFALGAPPMQIFASQAGQVYDVLEQGSGGIKGSLSAIGEGVLGLVTKFPLASAAVAAGAVALAAYAVVGGTRIRTLDDILKSHADNIRLLGDAYDQVSGKQQKYAALTARSVGALNEKDIKDAKDLLALQINSIFDSVEPAIGGGSGQQGPLERVLRSQFEPFKQALAELGKTSDVQKFIDEIDRIAEVNPSLSSARDELKGLALEAANTAARISEMSPKVSDLVDIVDQFNRQVADVTAEPIRKALQDIFDEARGGKEPLDEILTQIATLQQANPSFSGIIAGFRDLISKAYEASAAIDSISQSGPTNGRQKLPVGILPDSAPVPDIRPNAEDIGAANDKRAARAARGSNPYRDILKSAQDRIDQMKIELDLTGQVGVAVDTLRNYQELLSRATDHGRTIGEKQKAELHARAEEMAKLAQATSEAKLQQDLLYDRAQLGRSDIDQQIADMQRSAGLPVDLDSASAGMFRINEQIRTTQDAWKGFGDAAEDALGKLIDGTGTWNDALKAMIPALEDLIMQLLKAQSIGMGGSGDFSLGGLLSSAFGGGGGMNAFPGGGSLNSTGGLYANGGVFDRGISGFSNTVVDRPTRFKFASGAGLMGEAGPEGILPLRRNSAGQLGVMAANSNHQAPFNFTFAPVMQGGDKSSNDDGVKQLRKMFDQEFLPRTVKAIREAKTRGMLK